jgi:hypothetical protein
MKKMVWLVSAVLWLIGNYVMAQEADKTKIAVMDLNAKGGIEQPKALLLTDVICSEIAKLGNYEVVGRDDMKAMLEHLSDQQMLQCDDTKCLAQIGGALGVSELVAGNIGMVGTAYLINLKLINSDNVKVMNRISKEYIGDETGLIQEVKKTVAILFGKAKEEESTPQPQPAVAKAPEAPAAKPAPAVQATPSVTTKTAEKKPAEPMTINPEKKKGLPWVWIGIGGAVVIGGTAAALALSGGKTTEKDLPGPPPIPSAKRAGKNFIFKFSF